VCIEAYIRVYAGLSDIHNTGMQCCCPWPWSLALSCPRGQILSPWPWPWPGLEDQVLGLGRHVLGQLALRFVRLILLQWYDVNHFHLQLNNPTLQTND